MKKPSGWKGKQGERYWYKGTRFGNRSMCTDCGKETLGWARDGDRAWRHASCPRIAGPRKEWKGYVDAAGKVCVHRLTVEQDGCHETREQALLALDAELDAQVVRIHAQRADVAAMLAEKAGVAS